MCRLFTTLAFLWPLFCTCALGQPQPPVPPDPTSLTNVVLETPPPGPVPESPAFSEDPKAEEFFRVRVFEEPLIPIGEIPSQAENRALARALAMFARRTANDDFSALTDFLDAYPTTAWSPSLRFCLGLEYYRTGFYSRCIDEWEEVWFRIQDEPGGPGRRLADRTIGELVRMHARIGAAKRLEELFEEIQDRSLTGSSTELVAGARQALWMMRNKPEVSFRCGPLALRSVCKLLRPSGVDVDSLIQQSISTYKGFSLSQLYQLSQDVGLRFQLAKRKPGAVVIVPSVVHWKLEHYAAILRKDGDRYLVIDPTFGNSTWISQRAIDSESSGYFAVPPGRLPDGWESVTTAEGQTVWGKGVTSNNNPNHTTPSDRKAESNCGGSHGMAVANVHLMNVSLNITDTPIAFTPPRGIPVDFTITYNQREANQPSTFTYSNFGQKWTHNWLAYIKDNPSVPNADVEYYVEGGGTETFTGFNTNTQTYIPQFGRSQSSLTKLSTNSYELRLPDGSKKIFGQPDGAVGSSRKVFLTQVIDPTGYTNLLIYGSDLRLGWITDPAANATNLTFYYQSGSFVDSRKIKQIVDRYYRTNRFQYAFLDTAVTNIVDVLGLSSGFTYSGSFITKMRTPYGETSFAYGEAGRTRWLEITDPEGDKSRVEFNEYSNIGIPTSEPSAIVPTNIFARNFVLYGRNTFYWDKKAMREAQGDYSKAQLFHWLHSDDALSAISVLESVKMPLEGRVWFNYPGQGLTPNGATFAGTNNLPSKIARVLDDGTSQLFQFDRNKYGNITKYTDPAGRTFSYTYATNDIDLLEVRETRGTNNQLLVRFTYNAQHLPLIAVDIAGRTNQYFYNAYGQLTNFVNALHQSTALTYDLNGYLLSIDGPLSGTNDTLSFTYDSAGRVRALTDSEGYTITTDYDAFDRPTTNSYPDGTTEVFTYKYLDPETRTDRMGRVTWFVFDSLRQLRELHEGTNWITRFDWCRCGDSRSITDPLGRATTWEHDVQGRLKAKQYSDGTRVEYTYENMSSRLKAIKDEKGQVRIFEYFIDDNLKQLSYSNAQYSTPGVSFTYDPNFDRVATMQDGIGTTTYGYNPITSPPGLGAGLLASIDGPLANDTITFNYDALGRITNRAINAISSRWLFDEMGRMTNASNSLGVFAYTYTNATRRLFSMSYPNGHKAYFSYLGNLGDQLLAEIKHLTSGSAIISKFNYGYNPVGQITNWTQQVDAATPQVYSLLYDPVDELTNAVVATNSVTFKTYGYTYDLGGNRTTESIDGATRRANYNPLNELINQDADGSSTTRYYEWDAESRLLAIVIANRRTEFTYDGMNRIARIVEKTNGVAGSDRRFVWCGAELCEERNSTGSTVTKRFFPQGVQSGGVVYFYTLDHLGSIREVTDTAGAVQARYAYDPFGRRTKLSGSLDVDLGFAGLYEHVPSGLQLALYRPYDSDTGRWLSRDPIGESGGHNLYRYAWNDPINWLDPDGLSPCPQGIQGPLNSLGGGGSRPPRSPPVASSAGSAGGGSGWGPQNANGATRLARDVAVNPRAPAIRPTAGRSIGRASHNQALQRDLANLPAQAKDIRVNQQQVNALGERVGINRPDLQYTLNGQRYYIEYEGIGAPRGASHISRLLANDPLGIPTVLVVP
jgi:RHS repeat-associated protein